MPIGGFDFAIGLAIMIGLPIAVVLLNKWRPKAGWGLIVAVVGFVIVGNLIERLATGSSPLF
jgi:predicted PurR-regulated permease PerM